MRHQIQLPPKIQSWLLPRSQRNLNAWEQIQIVCLVLNGVAVVVYLAPLAINLGADDGRLVIYLIPAIASVVLIISKVDSLISAISLIGSLECCSCLVVAGSLEKLSIVLNSDMFSDVCYLVSEVTAVVLVISLVDSLISAISLVVSQECCGILVAGCSLQALIILLETPHRKRVWKRIPSWEGIWHPLLETSCIRDCIRRNWTPIVYCRCRSKCKFWFT